MSATAGARGLISVRIPMWIRVQVENTEPTVLCEIPTESLSNTWFGHPTAGELCYALDAQTGSGFDTELITPWHVTCPISIVNSSGIELEFARLALHVEALPVLEGATRLWSREVQATYRGDDRPFQIQIDTENPKYESIGARLSEPRVQVRQNESVLWCAWQPYSP